jgi:hypothetical protein
MQHLAAVLATLVLIGIMAAPILAAEPAWPRLHHDAGEAVGENQTFFKIAWSVPLLSEVATCFAAGSLNNGMGVLAGRGLWSGKPTHNRNSETRRL